MSETGGGTATRPPRVPGLLDTWATVVRFAHLLTADHAAAQELAAAALARSPRRRAVDPRRTALALAESPLQRLRARRRTAPAEGDPFLAAYLALPARDRALLVLRVADGLDAPAAAQVLGRRPEEAAGATEAALDVLAAALAPAGTPADLPQRTGRGGDAVELDLGELMLPSEPAAEPSSPQEPDDPLSPGDPVVARLAALFGQLAGEEGAEADPALRVAAAAASARRRRRGAVAVAGVLALAVAGAGTLVVRRHEADVAERLRVERQRALDAVLHPVVTTPDVTGWPTRGSLAGRADLVTQVRAAVTAEESVKTTVLAVPFLGEVGGHAVAITVVKQGGGGDGFTVLTLDGDLGRAVTSWEVSRADVPSERLLADELPVLSAALQTRDGRVLGVVVTLSSGVTASWSQRPDIDAQGRVERRFTALPLVDGVGTGVWQAPVTATLMRLQRGAGDPVERGVQVVKAFPASRTPLPQREAASCRAAIFADLRLNLANVARGAADRAGRGPESIVSAQSLGCVRVGAHRLMLVVVRLDNGAVLHTQLEQIVEDDSIAQVDHPVWPGPRAAGAAYPRLSQFTATGDDDPVQRVAVFCAPGGATAELVQGGPEAPALLRARLDREGIGVATGRLPPSQLVEGQTDQVFVVVRDARGREIERVPYPAEDVLAAPNY